MRRVVIVLVILGLTILMRPECPSFGLHESIGRPWQSALGRVPLERQYEYLVSESPLIVIGRARPDGSRTIGHASMRLAAARIHVLEVLKGTCDDHDLEVLLPLDQTRLRFLHGAFGCAGSTYVIAFLRPSPEGFGLEFGGPDAPLGMARVLNPTDPAIVQARAAIARTRWDSLVTACDAAAIVQRLLPFDAFVDSSPYPMPPVPVRVDTVLKGAIRPGPLRIHDEMGVLWFKQGRELVLLKRMRNDEFRILGADNGVVFAAPGDTGRSSLLPVSLRAKAQDLTRLARTSPGAPRL